MNISGERLSMNATSMSGKAEELDDVVLRIAREIEEIDSAILNLVKNGIQGSAVEAMAEKYCMNRQTISDFVKRFASTAVVLSENASNMEKVDKTAF